MKRIYENIYEENICEENPQCFAQFFRGCTFRKFWNFVGHRKRLTLI